MKKGKRARACGTGNNFRCFLFYGKRCGGQHHRRADTSGSGKQFMGFFSSSITILQTLVTAIGAGLGVWGVINLLEGYGNDNPGAKSHGIKQLMAGGGVILIGTQLVPQLANLFG